MRPRTLRRRGRFYHRKRSRWRLGLALALIGAVLAGFVVVDISAGPPPPGPPEDTAKRIAAPTAHAPAQDAAAEPGPTKLASAASVSGRLLRPGRPGSLTGGPAPDANRRGFDGAGARLGVAAVRDVNVADRAQGSRALVGAVMHSPAQDGSCKTCGDDVPF